MKQMAVVMAFFVVAFGLAGCLPEQTVVDGGGIPEKSGEIIIAGSLLVTEEEITAGMTLQEKGAGGVFTPLTPTQWTDIINGKAVQVQYIEVRLSDGGGKEVYNGIFPVINGGFNVLIKNFPAGTYSINMFFMNESINQAIFYANDLIDVWPNQPTTVNLVAYLNNYCEKKIRLIGMDPQIAAATRHVKIIIGDAWIIGEVFWGQESPDNPESPMIMDIIFRNNLSFDFLQPSPLVFSDENLQYLGGMLLQNVDPVSLTDWATLTYVPINTSDIIINVMTAPPIGVL